jgi:hypothetical protein
MRTGLLMCGVILTMISGFFAWITWKMLYFHLWGYGPASHLARPELDVPLGFGMSVTNVPGVLLVLLIMCAVAAFGIWLIMRSTAIPKETLPRQHRHIAGRTGAHP